jgi:hypothetical protein
MKTPTPPAEFVLNADVTTPNGEGVVNGWMEEDGRPLLLVRHTLARMTGKAAGICITPRGVFSALYAYPLDQVTRSHGTAKPTRR